MSISYRIRSANQLLNPKKLGAEYIIVPMEKLKENQKNKAAFIIEPPRFIKNENAIIGRLRELYKVDFSHLMVNNLAYLRIGEEIGFTMHGDFGLNIANIYSAETVRLLGLADITASLEIKMPAAAEMAKLIKTGIIAYGYVPLMLAIKRPLGKYNQNLFDRTGRKFTVKCSENYCEILNSDVLDLADKLPEKGLDFITFYFNEETETEILEVLDSYRQKRPPTGKFTRGLYFR